MGQNGGSVRPDGEGNFRSNRRYALVAVAVLLACGLLWFLYQRLGRGPAQSLTPSPVAQRTVQPLTRALFRQIKPQMSEAEVIKVLGPPATKGPGDPKLVGSRDFDMLTWEDGRIKIVVGFYDGKAMSTNLIDLTKP